MLLKQILPAARLTCNAAIETVYLVKGFRARDVSRFELLLTVADKTLCLKCLTPACEGYNAKQKTWKYLNSLLKIRFIGKVYKLANKVSAITLVYIPLIKRFLIIQHKVPLLMTAAVPTLFNPFQIRGLVEHPSVRTCCKCIAKPKLLAAFVESLIKSSWAKVSGSLFFSYSFVCCCSSHATMIAQSSCYQDILL